MQLKKFWGKISDDYTFITRATTDYEFMHEKLVEVVKGFTLSQRGRSLRALDIGCGVGATALHVKNIRHKIQMVTIDNEPKMIRQARNNLAQVEGLEIVQADALEYLKNTSDNSLDLIVSALTIHNFKRTFRTVLLREIYRVLKPHGLFANADKYVPDDDTERFKQLEAQIKKFFRRFKQLGKADLLEQWVLHYIDDQTPRKAMKQQESIREMEALGFTKVKVVERFLLGGVLAAYKPNPSA